VGFEDTAGWKKDLAGAVMIYKFWKLAMAL
jgi:hypothetical protein